MGRELEGCELGPFITFGNIPPVLETGIKVGGEVAGKTDVVTRVSQVSKNAEVGKATEAQQLAKNGLEKNTKPQQAVDPKTGKEGTTIPDAMKPDGGTVEVKNVQKQSLTDQLRLQKEISNGNGTKPELIINESAKLSKPLQKAGFDIKTYELNTTVKDNTDIPKPDIPKLVTPTQ